jgi:hypothetical protein
VGSSCIDSRVGIFLVQIKGVQGQMSSVESVWDRKQVDSRVYPWDGAQIWRAINLSNGIEKIS